MYKAGCNFSGNRPKGLFILTFALFLVIYSNNSHATNVSNYLPLKQNPYLESHVNRLMIAAEMAAVKRPYSINHVKMAATKLCENQKVVQPALRKGCNVVKTYLQKLNSEYAVNHLSTSLRLTKDSHIAEGQPKFVHPNQRGEHFDSNWQVQGQASWMFNDYIAFNGGLKAWDGEVTPEDSYISVGIPSIQVDVGYKPHWLSPFKQSAMLLSTNAPTFANVSISNNTPLTDWNFNYELFAGQLSKSNRIYYQGKYTQGKPTLTGIHLSISPIPGFTLAVNRILQSGGGNRGNGFGDIIDAFFDPSGSDNTSDDLSVDEQFGNQAASIVSRFDFSGNTPYSLYFEYAGEDTSRGTNYRLGNSSLSAGIDFPLLFNHFSLNYEYSNWQNGWYAHSVYNDGLTNKGLVIGHFGADQRFKSTNFAGQAIGASVHNLEMGWQLAPSERLELAISQVKNSELQAIDYVKGRSFSLDWFTQLGKYDTRISFTNSKNTLGEKHSSITMTFFFK